MQYLPPENIAEYLYPLLQRAVEAVPVYDRPTLEDQLDWLEKGTQQLYVFNDGLALLERRSTPTHNVLVLAGFVCVSGSTGRRLRKLIKWLQEIAADWSCDVVETLCFDLRLAEAIRLLGGKVESVTMTLPAGGSDGQQENYH